MWVGHGTDSHTRRRLDHQHRRDHAHAGRADRPLAGTRSGWSSSGGTSRICIRLRLEAGELPDDLGDRVRLAASRTGTTDEDVWHASASYASAVMPYFR